MLNDSGRLLFTASLETPLLVTIRIPDRAPPALSFITSNKVIVSIETPDSGGKKLRIVPNPGLVVRDFVGEVYYYLLEEVLPETIPLRIRWSGQGKYRLGFSAVLIYSLVKALETFYDESFEKEDLIGILSSLLMERGIGRVESQSISRSIVNKSIALVSSTGEVVEQETAPLDVVFARTVEVSNRYANTLEGEVLDLLAKTSSYTVFSLMKYISSKQVDSSLLASLSLVTDIYNSIWRSLYKLPYSRIANSGFLTIAPSLPGEVTYTVLQR